MRKQLISKASFALLIVLAFLAALPVLPAQAATRTASVTGNWNNPATWGGSPVPGAADDIIISSGVIVTVPGGYSASCNSINFTTGTTGLSSISLASSTSSLTVSGAVTIQEQASGGNINQINVAAGTFSAASVALSATTNDSRASQILISTGTVTISGNIISSGSASRIIFSGAGRLYVGGSFMSGIAGTFTPSTSTVNFNGTGAQMVGAYAFYDLVLSGANAKSLPSGVSVTDNMSITGTATASVAAGQNLSVETLTLGGVGTADGTWGSTSSPATNQTNTYFALTTGYLTVATDTRTPQGTLEVTGPASVTYGTTGTITYSGGSGTGALSYSHGSSTGCIVNSTTGVVTVTDVPGSCNVTATKAADKYYLVATSEEFTITLVPRAVTLTGTRPYDTTNLAVAAILSITNKVGTDVVSVASGSATLASADVGTREITSVNTLTFGGADAANYTFSGASGSVTITKADQATLTVTGPASVAYGSTGTITHSGGSGTGALSYSHGSSTACTVNSTTGEITVSSVSGSCTVTATKAADSNYNPATSAGFDVTPAPRPVTLTGSRVYDTTTVAAAAILSITNRVGADTVNVASGSATLAGANAGTQSITSMNTLTLGGANAANYTLLGASGSVTITKANQTITFPAPASPAAYLSTFPVAPTSDSLLSVTVTPSGVCSILDNTVTMTSGTGICTLTASQAGNINYNAASQVVRTVTAEKIDQATLTVTGPASVAYGSTGTITYSGGSGTGAVTYGNVTGMGCTVNSSTGVITVTNVSQGCIVIVNKAADSNYNEASAYKIIPLFKATQAVLTVTGPASITYGTTGMITYSGGSGTGAISYSQGSSTGCMVNSSTGEITVSNVSSGCIVTVTKAADTNYDETTSAGFEVILNKAGGSVSINNLPVKAVVGGWFTPTFTKLGDGTTLVASNTLSTCIEIEGVVKFVGLGTCTLQAFVTEGSNYLAAIGSLQSFEISEPYRIYLNLILR